MCNLWIDSFSWRFGVLVSWRFSILRSFGGYVLVVHLDDTQVPIPDQIEGLPSKRVVVGAFRKFN
jgi:hypothetical protein